MRRHVVLVSLALLSLVSLLGLSGCESSTPGVCTDDQCPKGQHCVSGACAAWDGSVADRGALEGGSGAEARVLDLAARDGGKDAPGDGPKAGDGKTEQGKQPDGAGKDGAAKDGPKPDGAGKDAPKPDAPKPDAPKPDLLAPDTCPLPCGTTCCSGGQACLSGTCYTPIGACKTSDDCLNDSYCTGGQCVPFGVGPYGVFDPTCLRVIPPGIFQPALQCEWSGPPTGDPYPNHKNVLGTPVVIDFGNQGEGAPPSIVFVSYDRTDGGGEAARCDSGAFGVIRVIRGSDCAQLWTVENVQVRASSPLAVGDLDGDGRAEIVAYRCGGGVVAVRWDGTQKKFVQHWVSNPSNLGGTELLWSGPSIHDLDNDGKPEVLMGGIVFSNAGVALDSALGTLSPTDHQGGFAVVADLDGDGQVELANGQNVWAWTVATKKWAAKTTSANATGLVAVADFGTFGSDPTKDDRSKLDGIAELAVVRSGSVVVQTIAGRVVFGPVSLPGGGSGGPPTVGDFDSDGRAELACAGYGGYTIFDPDCKTGAVATTCPSLATTGILWTQPSKDYSSSSTGSSIFDFEGDGAAEAIYADECFTRVYEGKTGEVLFSQYHTSCTWYENPIVADTDRDFQSELVVPSNINCSKFAECTSVYAKAPSGAAMDPLFKGFRCKTGAECPGGNCSSGFCRCASNADCAVGSYECAAPVAGTPGSGNVCRSIIPKEVAGVRVYRDIQDRWVDSRPIWNQHAYSVTNVKDDGTIPATAAWSQNWKQSKMNNFRQNQQGQLNPSTVPDLTARPPGVSCAAGAMSVQAEVCNRGTKAVGAGVSLTAYVGDPKAGGKVGCTATTKKVLAIGVCELVSCSIAPSPVGKVDLYLVADDAGGGKEGYVECYDKNNTSVLKGAICP